MTAFKRYRDKRTVYRENAFIPILTTAGISCFDTADFFKLGNGNIALDSLKPVNFRKPCIKFDFPSDILE